MSRKQSGTTFPSLVGSSQSQRSSHPSSQSQRAATAPSGSKRPSSRKIEPGLSDEAVALLRSRELMRVRLREDHQRQQIQQAEKVWHEERECLEKTIAEKDATIAEKEGATRKLDSKVVHLQTTISTLHEEISSWRERMKLKESEIEELKQEAAADLEAARDEVKFVTDLRKQLSKKEEDLKEITAAYRRYLHKDVHRADWQADDLLQHFTEHKSELETLVTQFAQRATEKLKSIGLSNSRPNSRSPSVGAADEGTEEPSNSSTQQPPVGGGSSIATLCQPSTVTSAVEGIGRSSNPDEVQEIKILLQEIRGMQQYLYTLQQSGMPASLVGFTELATMGYSMHSNYPPQVKIQLYGMDKEQLLVVLDSLSFLDGVVEYVAKDLTPRYMVQLKPNTQQSVMVQRSSAQ